MKIKKILQIALGIALALILVTVCSSGAFFLTSFVYKNIGLHLSTLPVQIINSLLGLFFAVFLVASIILIGIKKKMPQQGGIFESIIRAIEKIARGDFNVRVDNTNEGIGPFGELVKSVNNMAVELSQMEKMRQEFISNVSHEIQSPLTSIRGFAQALRSNELSPEDRLHYLGIIETESVRLSKLSDNLLRLASLEAETIKFEPKSYRLDKQIRNIVLACEPQWVEKELDMEVSIDEATITADEDMMSQVWINLIHNSIKFTPNGGRVSVDLHQCGDKMEFKISDTGIGISEEAQNHVFERFYKADKSRERSNKGSGLGLSIAKKIVDMHHGDIGVRSNLCGGSMFIVTLPLRV